MTSEGPNRISIHIPRTLSFWIPELWGRPIALYRTRSTHFPSHLDQASPTPALRQLYPRVVRGRHWHIGPSRLYRLRGVLGAQLSNWRVEMAQARRPFEDVESTRPAFDHSTNFVLSKTVRPDWKWGDGANDGGIGLAKKHLEINPCDPARSAMDNYKLLISGIIPRPVGFLSTQSEDGTSQNLAPFSYTQVVNHDPPIFVVGFAGSGDKDTLKNLKATGECVINIISEHFIEAANAAAIDAPYGISEWQLTGLTPASCAEVKANRVLESIFSIEGKLLEVKDFESKFAKGVKSGSMAIIEGVRFWVREDALTEDQRSIDPAVLRPVARLGGIVYGRVTNAFEILRPRYNEQKEHLPT